MQNHKVKCCCLGFSNNCEQDFEQEAFFFTWGATNILIFFVNLYQYACYICLYLCTYVSNFFHPHFVVQRAYVYMCLSHVGTYAIKLFWGIYDEMYLRSRYLMISMVSLCALHCMIVCSTLACCVSPSHDPSISLNQNFTLSPPCR